MVTNDRFLTGVGSEITMLLRDGVECLWCRAGVLAMSELSRHAPPQRGGCVLSRRRAEGKLTRYKNGFRVLVDLNEIDSLLRGERR